MFIKFNNMYNNNIVSNSRKRLINYITPFMRHCSSAISSVVYLPLTFEYDLLCFKDFEFDSTFKHLSLYDIISLFIIGSISASKKLKLDIASSGVNLFSYPVLLICLFDLNFRIAFRNYVSSLRINNSFPLGIVLVLNLFQAYRFGDKCSHLITSTPSNMDFNVQVVRDYLLNLLYCCGCLLIIKDGSKITEYSRDELLVSLMSDNYILELRRLRPINNLTNIAITRLLAIIKSDNRFSALLINQLIAIIVLISRCLNADDVYTRYDGMVAILLHDLNRFCLAFQLKASPIDFSDFRSSDLGLYAYSFCSIPNLISGLNFSITAGSSATPSGVMFYFACMVQPILIGANVGSVGCSVGLSNSMVISSILTPMELIFDAFVSCLFADSSIVPSPAISASKAGSFDAKPNGKMAPVASQLVSPDVTTEQVTTAKSPVGSTVKGSSKSGKTAPAMKGIKSVKPIKADKVLKEANA